MLHYHAFKSTACVASPQSSMNENLAHQSDVNVIAGHGHDDLNEIYLQVCRRVRTNSGVDAVNDGERA
jgi:hypothetical protein